MNIVTPSEVFNLNGMERDLEDARRLARKGWRIEVRHYPNGVINRIIDHAHVPELFAIVGTRIEITPRNVSDRVNEEMADVARLASKGWRISEVCGGGQKMVLIMNPNLKPHEWYFDEKRKRGEEGNEIRNL